MTFVFHPLRVILPGCLAQPQSAKAQQLLRTLIHSKQKVRRTRVAEPSCKAFLSPPPGVTDGGVSMFTRGCFPGGIVSEVDRETGETLCHTATGIPPAVQVSVASVPHKTSSPSHMPSLTHTPSQRTSRCLQFPAGSAAAGLCSCGGSHWRQEQTLGGDGQH